MIGAGKYAESARQGAPKTRQAVGLVLLRPETRSREQVGAIRQLTELHSKIRETFVLFDRFARMLRERTDEALKQWLDDAVGSGIAELARFVTKLRQDLDTVQATLTTE